MKKILPMLLPLLLSACTALTLQTGTLTLSEGQTGQLGGKTISLLSLSDSRCRPKVQCVWAGELTATVKVNAETLVLKWPARVNTPWAGLRITKATFDQPVKVTFSDRQP